MSAINTFLFHRDTVDVAAVVKQRDNYVWETFPANVHVDKHQEQLLSNHPVQWPEMNVDFVGKKGGGKGGDKW